MSGDIFCKATFHRLYVLITLNGTDRKATIKVYIIFFLFKLMQKFRKKFTNIY